MDADHKEIKDLRKQIDIIDQEILKILKERIRIIRISLTKKENQIF